MPNYVQRLLVPFQWDVALSAQPTTQVLFWGECLKAGTHRHHKHTHTPPLPCSAWILPHPSFSFPFNTGFLELPPFLRGPCRPFPWPGSRTVAKWITSASRMRKKTKNSWWPFIPAFPSHSYICSTPSHSCLPWVKRVLRPERTDWFFLFLYEMNLVWLQEIETVFICSPIHIFHESPLLGKKSNPVKLFLPALYWCKYLPRHIITQNNSQWN